MRYCVLSLLLSVSIIFSSQIFPQVLEWQQTNGPYGGYTHQIAVSPNGYLFSFVGRSLYISTDNGLNWNKTLLDVQANESTARIVVNSQGEVFVGYDGYICKSTDNYKWKKTKICSDYITNLKISPSGNLYLTAGNKLYYSIDNGETWQTNIANINSTWIQSLSVDSDSIFFLTTSNGIFNSTDYGKNWIEVTNNLQNKSIYGIKVTKNGNVLVGADGNIYSSSNFGNSWKLSYQKNYSAGINIFEEDPEGNIWASNCYFLIKTNNDGYSWSFVKDFGSGAMTSIKFISDGKIFISSGDGCLISEDNGNSWKNSKSGLIGTYCACSAKDREGNIYVSASGNIYSTTDQGENWNICSNVKTVLNGVAVSITINEKNHIFLGDGSGICKSTDKGLTWTRKNFNNYSEIVWSVAISENKVFALTKSRLFYSSDYGDTWKIMKEWEDDTPIGKIYYHNNGYLLMVREKQLFKSNNDGLIWSKILPMTSQVVHDVMVSKKGSIIAAITDGVLISNDDGMNWNFNYIVPNSSTIGLFEAPDRSIFAEVDADFYYSKDNCASWTILDSYNERRFYMRDLEVDKNGYLLVGTQSQGVFRSSLPVLKILSPVTKIQSGDQKAYLTWNKNTSSNFHKYNIYGSYKHYPDSLIASTTNGVNDTTAIIEGLFNNSPFYIVVSAVDNEGNESFSDEITVIPVPLPTVPQLSSISNGSNNTEVDLLLKWKKSSYATSYHLQLSVDSTFSTFTINDSSLIDTLKQVNGLTNNTKYFWRVRAAGVSGISEWSEAWSFTTIVAVPEIPVAVSPLDKSINMAVTQQFRWNKAERAVCYHFQLSKEQSFSDFIIGDSTLIDTLLNLTLGNGTEYYWRVRANNVGGYSPWSEVRNFKTIVALPNVPVLTSPSNGSKNLETDLKLSWNNAEDAEVYGLLLALDASFSNIIIEDTALTAASMDVKDLLTGMKYYWKVKAMNIAGTSGYSPTWNFTTILRSPESLTAENSGIRKVKLTWIDKTENESGFVLERNTEGEASYRIIDSIKANAQEYLDSTVSGGISYKYRIKSYTQFAASAYSNEAVITPLTSVTDRTEIPTEYALIQNYPNPFNPSTKIEYSVPYESQVTIRIYSTVGEVIKEFVDEIKHAGYYQVTFNASHLSSGIYFYTITASSVDGRQNYSSVKKMILMK